MTRGRRPSSRKKRLRQREWQYEAHRRQAFEPELTVAIEVGLDSFHRYRTSPERQELGWWGRWLAAWRRVGLEVNWKSDPLGALAEIYRREFEGVIERMADCLAITGWRDVRVVVDPNVPRDRAYVVPSTQRFDVGGLRVDLLVPPRSPRDT